MGRIAPETVAAANSQCVALAAAGLLGSAEDAQRLEARVLCFDEMQVCARAYLLLAAVMQNRCMSGHPFRDQTHGLPPHPPAGLQLPWRGACALE